MCGGKGERIKDFCSDKAMLKLNNEPLIEHILVSLKDSKKFDRKGSSFPLSKDLKFRRRYI